MSCQFTPAQSCHPTAERDSLAVVEVLAESEMDCERLTITCNAIYGGFAHAESRETYKYAIRLRVNTKFHLFSHHLSVKPLLKLSLSF